MPYNFSIENQHFFKLNMYLYLQKYFDDFGIKIIKTVIKKITALFTVFSKNTYELFFH